MRRAPSSACIPPTGFTFRIRSEIPLSGGLGSSAAAIVAGLVAADHMFELDADVLGHANELEGHPDNVAAALLGGFVVCAEGRAERIDPPAGLEAVAVVPAEQVSHAGGPRRAARRGAAGRRGLQHRARLAADARPRARGLGPRLPRPRRPPAPAAPRAPVPALDGARRPQARHLGALGATISGAGPTVLVWSHYEQTGGVFDRLRAEVDGWARVMRLPFAVQGADVRAL